MYIPDVKGIPQFISEIKNQISKIPQLYPFVVVLALQIIQQCMSSENMIYVPLYLFFTKI